MCVCSAKRKKGFDTEIKLAIVTRHCLTGTRDERGREEEGGERKLFPAAVRGGDIMEHN